MSDRTIGWLFVGAQAALLVTLIALPSGDSFTVPDWLRTTADVAFVAGCAIAVAAAISLGRALTATPVPTDHATLRTGGLYRFARHPIYTGVIVIVVAVAVRSGSFIVVAVGAATLVFFGVKARWEERRLAARYPGYVDYAARTPRFVPHPFR